MTHVLQFSLFFPIKENLLCSVFGAVYIYKPYLREIATTSHQQFLIGFQI